jgi:hypothetical protein
MSVHLVADVHTKLSVLRVMLEHRYVITSELLNTASVPRSKLDSIVVAADLTVVENITALKAISGRLARIPRRVFLIDGTGRLSVVQAYALGATHVLSNPVNQRQLLAKLADAEAPAIPTSGSGSGSSREAASAGCASIAAMFSAVLKAPRSISPAPGTRAARSQKASPKRACPIGSPRSAVITKGPISTAFSWRA